VKFEIKMYPCALCKGVHAHWWLTSKVRPPSCEERIRRLKPGG
jgi:hypothetical protein